MNTAFDDYQAFADRTLGVRSRVRADRLKVGDVFASGERVAATLAGVDFLGRRAIFLTIEKTNGSTYGRQSSPETRWAVAA